MLKYEYFIPLQPRVLKNSRVIVPQKTPTGFRIRSFPSKLAQQFMAEAKKYLNTFPKPEKPIDYPVTLRLIFYGPWKKDDRMPDISNLYQTIEDLLEDAGILENDMFVVNHDGSRRVPLCSYCPHRKKIKQGKNKGQYQNTCGAKKSCSYVGVKVEITPDNTNNEDILAVKKFTENVQKLQI